MPYSDYQEFLAYLEKRGQVRRVSSPVNRELEIAAIAERAMKMPGGSPALLFENPVGSRFPVLVNALATTQRVAWALGLPNLQTLSERAAAFLRPNTPQSLSEKLLRLGELPEVVKFGPRPVKGALCQQVVHEREASLNLFPALKMAPGEVGFTLGRVLLVGSEPGSGKIFFSAPRLQILNGQTAGLIWPDEDSPLPPTGKRLEVALVLGDDPALLLTACAALPVELDPFVLAGYLRRLRVEVTRGVRVNLDIPANAECILEGYIEPGETHPCGPLAENSGYYSPARPCPVFHLTALTHRRNPVFPLSTSGLASPEELPVAKVRERLLLPFIRQNLPEVVDINLLAGGAFNQTLFVSLRKNYPGQAEKVMYGLWGMSQLKNIKFMVVVDADCDVQNPLEVAARCSNNLDPRRDLHLVNGPLSVLDYASPSPRYGAKVGLDATAKLPEENYPREWPARVELPPEIRHLVDEKWASYGID